MAMLYWQICWSNGLWHLPFTVTMTTTSQVWIQIRFCHKPAALSVFCAELRTAWVLADSETYRQKNIFVFHSCFFIVYLWVWFHCLFSIKATKLLNSEPGGDHSRNSWTHMNNDWGFEFSINRCKQMFQKEILIWAQSVTLYPHNDGVVTFPTVLRVGIKLCCIQVNCSCLISVIGRAHIARVLWSRLILKPLNTTFCSSPVSLPTSPKKSSTFHKLSPPCKPDSVAGFTQTVMLWKSSVVTVHLYCKWRHYFEKLTRICAICVKSTRGK